jgi:ribosomal protein S18 acetylase RimI-like enzyme
VALRAALGLLRPRVGSGRRRRASERWRPATFRLFVAAWNERAIRLYRRLGFGEVAREMPYFELVGVHEFIQMERVR